ncbi:MAG: hypothetical protein F6J95_030750 [Leptolyngbya sp. SIO1E4]|nr:hypothetical protein [Leptolyngbya sp. SIO1E4]
MGKAIPSTQQNAAPDGASATNCAIAHQSLGIPSITVPSQNGTVSGNLGHAIGFAMPLANAVNDSTVMPELPPRSLIGALWGCS